jgi:prolipoprotein diacylglyceryltransferase
MTNEAANFGGSPVYALTTVVGIACTALLWRRLLRSDGRTPDQRLWAVYGGALAGAYLGAKVAFLVAEGWHHRGDWVALLTGHSVAGALLGGVCGVELAKSIVGYRAGTGDLFAVTVPMALAIGRVGCMFAGCCQGVECGPAWWTVTDAAGHARWPAAAAELAFNLLFWAWAMLAWRFGWQRTQRFNVYLVAYGCFRFAHEFLRDDARWWGAFGGYHVVALAIVATGVWMYVRRARTERTTAPA